MKVTLFRYIRVTKRLCKIGPYNSVLIVVEWINLRSLQLVSCPTPPRTCEKGGSGVLNDFFCHSSPIREFKSDCRTSSSTRSSMPAVRCTCTGNAIITFFMPFDPAPCDKNTRPSFHFSGEGSGDETALQCMGSLASFPGRSRLQLDELEAGKAWERGYGKPY